MSESNTHMETIPSPNGIGSYTVVRSGERLQEGEILAATYSVGNRPATASELDALRAYAASRWDMPFE